MVEKTFVVSRQAIADVLGERTTSSHILELSQRGRITVLKAKSHTLPKFKPVYFPYPRLNQERRIHRNCRANTARHLSSHVIRGAF